MLTLFKTVAAATPKLLGALLLAAGLSGNAHARVYQPLQEHFFDLGEVGSSGATFLSSSASAAQFGSGIFKDTISFHLNDLSKVAFSFESLISPGDANKFSFSSLYVDFYDNGLLKTLNADTGIASFGTQAAGDHYFYVHGVVNGTKGGIYFGDLAVSAVPELETYSMMLAGLGLVAVIGRRRPKTEVATFA